MLVCGQGDAPLEALRQHLGERRGALQLAGILADDLAIDRRAGLRLRRAAASWATAAGAAGVGLRDVGARALADLEARARGAHLLGQELQVALGQHGDLPVADDVHIGAAALNSVFCSVLRRLSLDARTCASAARTLFLVWKPSNRVCWISTPNEPVVMRASNGRSDVE